MAGNAHRPDTNPGAHIALRVLSAVAILASALAGALPPAPVRPALARSIGPWSDTTTADFAGCTTLTNVAVSNVAGGELRLAATVEDDFDGTALNATRWTSGRIYTWGGSAPTLSGGLLTLDSAYIRSQSAIAAGARAMEFRARLRASAQDTGWGSYGLGRQSQPFGTTSGFAHRLFETDNVNQLYATSRDGSAAGSFPTISGVDLTQWHTYRVEWGTTATQYFIDGALRQVYTGTATTSAWAWFYTADPGSQVEVDWVRVAPYPTSGEFISCAVDGEEPTEWGTLAMAADIPAGTAVTAETRTSADNVNWSAWAAVGAGGQIASPAGRFLQYRLTFSTSNVLVSPEVRQVVVTPQTGWRHTTLADLNQACAVLTNTSVADVDGGEVRLAATLEDYFYAPQIDYSRWITGLTNSASGVAPIQANGVITLNASYMRSAATITQTVRTFEARARLRVPPPNTAWGDIGFGRQSAPGGADAGSANRLFITTNANLVQANARTGSASAININLADVDPSLWHRYRIQWTPTNTYYWVDGALRVTDTVASTFAPYVWMYTLDPGSAIEVDWLRVDGYPASGAYQSCSLDAGQPTGWGALTWGGSAPAGTAVSFETRSSPDGASWSAWSALGAGNAVLSPVGRYLQYRATLSTTDSAVSPQVDWVQVSAAGALPAVIGAVSAAAAALPVQISAATDRPALGRVQYGQTPALGTWITGTEYLTAHNFALAGLQANTLYYYAFFAATPEGLESQSAVGTFTTPAGSLTQTTAAEFGQGASCATLTNAIIANAGGGEVRLRSTTLEDYFSTDGFFDTGQWVGRTITPSGPYTPTIAGGVVQVVSATVGARIRSINPYTPTQVIEFRAAYDPARYERIGFTDTFDQWALFTATAADMTGANVYAWTSNSGDGNDVWTALPALQINQFYTFRIEWEPDVVRYYVDGALVATHAIAIAGPMYAAMTNNVGNDYPFTMDWLRVLSTPPSGAYQSCAFDAGQTVNWDLLNWTASLPAGAGAAFYTRSSDDGLNWSAWEGPLTASGSATASPHGRYLQYRVDLTSADPRAAPEIQSVNVTYNLNLGPEPTAGPTNTPSNTPTASPTRTPSNTPTATGTATPSSTPTATATATASNTPTVSPTPVSAVTVSNAQHDANVYVDPSNYGQARHLVADSNGRFVMAYVDTGPALVLAYSNDGGASWTDVPVGTAATLPALAYDSVSDRLHLVYQDASTAAIVYQRYRFNRSGNDLAGFVSEGSLTLDVSNGRRPTLLWTADGGPGGTLLVAWSRTNDARTRQEIRASMRRLSNDAADFTAANWRAPDGAGDASPITLPNVAFNLIDGADGTGVGENGIACLAQRSSLGANAQDLYVVYGLYAGAVNEWRWRKADWSAAAGDWSGSGDWLAANTAAAGNFGSGSGSKVLTLSCVYDDVNDHVWFSAARNASGQDLISLYGITPADTLLSAGDVYNAGGTASRLPMSAIGFDPVTAGGEVWVLYVTGQSGVADGFIRYRTYRPGVGFNQAGDVYAVASNNYPNLLERRAADRLLGMFRTNTSPNTLRRVTIQFPPGPTPTPTVTPTASNTPTPTSTPTASDTPAPTSTATETPSATPAPPTATATETPLPPTATASATPTATPTGITHTSLADFGACVAPSGARLTNLAGGELRLAAVLEDYFDAATVDPAIWEVEQPYTWFTPLVTNTTGLVGLNGGGLRSLQAFTDSVRVFEARARLGDPNTGFGDIGFGGDGSGLNGNSLSQPPADTTRLFLTNDLRQLQTNTRDGAIITRTTFAAYDVNVFHDYRIVARQDQTEFYVDGALIRTDLSQPMLPNWVWLFTLFPGNAIEVDWVRVADYPLSGVFTACPIDAGALTSWAALTAAAQLPAGTGAQFETRTSGDGLAWSDWAALGAGGLIASPPGRFLQYRVNLSTADRNVSPQVDSVTVFPGVVVTPTATGTPTETPTPTATFTPSPTATASNTPTPSDTPTPTATATPSYTPTVGPSPTPTSTATPTATATPSNTPSPTNTATPTNTPGAANFALDYDGTNDYLQANAVPGTGPLTVEAWVRPDAANETGILVMSAANNSGWSLELEAGRATMWLSTSLGWQFNQNPTVLTAGQWAHVAATLSGGQLRVYVNGVGSTATSVGALTQGTAFRVGGFSTFQYFNGAVDEVRVSNTARYSANFSVPLAPYTADANTLLLLSFDEGSGQTTADESASANTATLGSAAGADANDPAWTTGYPFPGLGPTATPTPTPSNTPTATATFTPSNTPTNTATATATFTFTPGPSPTPTNTATPSNTPTNTATPTASNTPTATFTPSNTPSPTATPTASNTPTPAPTSSGNFGLSFDGNDSVSGAAAPGTGPLTVDAWVRPAVSNQNAILVMSAGNDSGWSLELSAGRPILWLRTNRGWESIQHATALAANTWYHVAAVYGAGGVAQVFVNGAPSGTLSAGTLTLGSTFRLGGFNGFSFFSGLLDEVRVSNVARYTAAFTPPVAPYLADASTVRLWSLDEGTGQTAADESGNGGALTLGSAAGADSGDPTWVTGYPFPDLGPTPTPSNTPTATNTPLPTNTPTATWTPSPTSTPTATFTPSNTPTATATPTSGPSPTPTNTATPTATATPSNTPSPTNTATPTNTPGAGNFALRYDGANDYLAANAVTGVGPLTIEAWVQPTANNETGIVVMSAGNDSGWSLELEAGQAVIWLRTTGGWQSARNTTALQAGQWYHVAVVYSGGQARVYINGSAPAGTTVGTLTQGQTFRAGGFNNFQYFAGSVDEVRVSNVARYSANFGAPTAPYVADANTLLLLSFDEGAGQTTADESASANPATLGSAAGADANDPTWVAGYPWP